MSRDEFEKFAAAEFGAINLLRWPDTGKYQVDLYEFAWQGFQAGHTLKCEEERKAGHAEGLEKGLDMAGNKAVETGWYVAAEEIRAMKEQKK